MNTLQSTPDIFEPLYSDPHLATMVLLGQSSGPSLSISWAIVIFGVLIGLALTLSPSRRTYEVKRPKDE